MALPSWTGGYLLGVAIREGQLGRDMEHDLPVPESGVHRLHPCLSMSHIQASSETVVKQSEAGEK